MRASFFWALCCAVASASFAQEATWSSCQAKVEALYDGEPLTALTAVQREQVVRAVLPALKADARASGYEEFSEQKLASLLRFKRVRGGRAEERLIAVRYELDSICGSHNNCPTYLFGLQKQGARSLIPAHATFGISVGGSFGVAVIDHAHAVFPDLIFLAHISGSETAAACYRWNGHDYAGNCSVPCVEILAHPQPDE